MKTALLALLSLSLSAAAATPAPFPSYLVKNKQDLKALTAKTEKAPKDSPEKSWLLWQTALNAPQVGEVAQALKALDQLSASKAKVIGEDHIQITRGRILFQKGQFDQAIGAYAQVPKTSEYWFEATEEEAWSYIRTNAHDKAIGKFTTLMSPVFQTWVGPETYFAANYNALKICDYPAIFRQGKQFKERHAPRIRLLEELAESGTNAQLSTTVTRLASGQFDFMAFAKEAPAMPRFFWRDEFLRRHVARLQELKKTSNEKALQAIHIEIGRRLQALAKAELSEYKTVIQKLHIIEAEVIQRLYLDESLKGQRPDLPQAKSDPNVLTFPENEELWLDEVDRHQAKVKSCPQLKEAQHGSKTNS